MEVKIQDIQANYDSILNFVGSQSYINWQTFTKSTSQLNKQIETLTKTLAQFREAQQKRFIMAMKKLKGTDIPDLIKTVKGKKLPKEALKTILNKFTIVEGKLHLVGSAEQLKQESIKNYEEYIQANSTISNQIKSTHELLSLKMKQYGYSEPQSFKQLVSTFKYTFSEEKIAQVCKAIPIHLQPGTVDLINIQTYGQIVNGTFDVAKEEYQRLTIESRIKQRKLMPDGKKYVEALVQYLTNTQVLILEAQRAIVRHLGLIQQKIQESEVHLMQHGLAQTILLLQSGVRTRIKQSFEPQKLLNLEKGIQLTKCQLALIKQKTPFFKNILGSLEKTPENFQIIPVVIALTLNDFIFEKYGIEEQDYMRSITDKAILTSPQIGALFKDLESSILLMMKQAGVINDDILKVMQMQSQQIQNQFAQMSQSQNLGGIFPGSNPNDLLLFQQMNQFEQMKKK